MQFEALFFFLLGIILYKLNINVNSLPVKTKKFINYFENSELFFVMLKGIIFNSYFNFFL